MQLNGKSFFAKISKHETGINHQHQTMIAWKTVARIILSFKNQHFTDTMNIFKKILSDCIAVQESNAPADLILPQKTAS